MKRRTVSPPARNGWPRGRSSAAGRAALHLARFCWAVGRHLLVLVLIGIWLGAVVYPDPRPFVQSVSRLHSPPIDAGAVAELAADLPADYKVLEDYALEYVVYLPAWTAYGLPWYFPSVPEVVESRAGDCQARAVFFASLLQAKELPYTLRYSFDHVWVDYPGKEVSDLEDPATSFVADSGEGWLARLPERIPVWSILKTRVAYHWTPMPVPQKALFLAGAAVIFLYGERRLLGRVARRLGLADRGCSWQAMGGAIQWGRIRRWSS